MPRLFVAKRNARSKQAKLHGVAANRGTRPFDFRAFDKPERHEPLHQRIVGVDGRYDRFLAAPERRKRRRSAVHARRLWRKFFIAFCH